ncbi:T9SS type A sorting domain-containing protein [Chitinophaga sp. SYP-B3965]|uniref:T9SS type A sorting domain-containing protein n=1 Tax=Chitinophaga sp. SYP-B3965 TaxID=2663120 RepID=UPI00129977A5|nr:T9SS type A sorting domain-containing protein [Chitinophaga sp. SYP-B3965]MRG45483.1 T9SS type A sorting domain-containing protein [Chitinophaga sp. SYP-B3965]
MKKIYLFFSLLLLNELTAYAQQQLYYDIPGGPAEILDFKDNRLLFWRDSAYHIHQLHTQTIIDIPLSSPPAFAEKQIKSGWLTDSGAFITTPSTVAGMVALYEWRNNQLTEIEKQATSVEVGGNFVLFTSWGYFYHKRPNEATIRVSTNPGTFAMSPEGWFLYSINDTLYKYQQGAATPFATGETTGEWFWYVTIDGQDVLYMMEKAQQSPTLYLYNGTTTDTVAILRGVHQQVFHKRQYYLNNGHVAFVSIDKQGTWPGTVAETNIYVRGNDGVRRLAFTEIGPRNVAYVYPWIWGVDEAGGLLVRKDSYLWQNGLHYTPLDSASRFIVPIAWNGGLIPGLVYKDQAWFTFYKDSVYRLFPDGVQPEPKPVYPAVTLSANRNVINNNNDTIILTAHGNVPGLYTFARDAAFTDLLKPEDTDSVLKLHPAAFTRRDNDVYVRMRIGDSTATDNIRILKTFLSGIPGKDFDNKSQIIVYPNPFTTQFMVEGLESAKRYRFTLHALNGTVMFTMFVNYQHKHNVIPHDSLRKGIYFLEIFDLSTQKVAGGSILLKM